VGPENRYCGEKNRPHSASLCLEKIKNYVKQMKKYVHILCEVRHLWLKQSVVVSVFAHYVSPMKSKVVSDGSGRDSYIVMNMRDFEANARGRTCGYQPQFASAHLRDYDREEAASSRRQLRPRTPTWKDTMVLASRKRRHPSGRARQLSPSD
jgi:hypothetical protein